jgi:hypothetical protein
MRASVCNTPHLASTGVKFGPRSDESYGVYYLFRRVEWKILARIKFLTPVTMHLVVG